MKVYLLDLDGTLADSRPGLYPSFRAALTAIGVPVPSDEQLARFLGTPLPEMFRAIRPDISEPQIELGMKAFRSTYEHEGITQNRVYPGVPAMLSAILARDCAAWVVTSKPEHYAVQVVQLLALDRYVQGVVGAGLDEKDTKTSLIARALAAAGVTNNEAMMVGDRHYDIIGALENKVLPIGALWGYGSYDELCSAGCMHFAQSADDFRKNFVETEPAVSGDRQSRRSTAALF